MTDFDWNENGNFERLKKLWADGLSASEVARKLGEGVTRNAVLSKVHRSGLGRGTPSANHVKKRKFLDRENDRKREKRAAGQKFNAHPVGPTDKNERPVEKVEPIVVEVTNAFPKVEGLPSALVRRDYGQCCWPIGDPHSPSFHFCTNRKDGEGIYCRQHRRMSVDSASSLQWAERRKDWALANPGHKIAKIVLKKLGLTA